MTRHVDAILLATGIVIAVAFYGSPLFPLWLIWKLTR